MIEKLAYKSKSNTRKMLLRREISALQLGIGEPISMYVARAKNQSTRTPCLRALT
jgi:hypothetical protein